MPIRRGRRAALAAEGVSTPKRHGTIPGTYFVTSRTWESRALFIREEACNVFIASLLHYRAKGAYALHAFVLMPDHFHALLTLAPDKSLERVVQFIKGGSAHCLGSELSMRFPVWQRGFSDHRLRDAGDYQAHLEYIAQNPVRRRLSATPKEFAWSSASGKWPLDEPPQRLKPRAVADAFGAAEVVP